MEIHLDCLPCTLRQVLKASRMATDNYELQKKIMAKIIGVLNNYEAFKNAPEMVGKIHEIIKDMTGAEDPYCRVKKKDIETAQRILPDLKRFLEGQEDRLYWALKASAVGNVLDSVIDTPLDIEKNIEDEFLKPFAICDIRAFEDQIRDARSILFIGDNAGETVFDTILMEELSPKKMYYAVRNSAVLNDATATDALASGISHYGEIISTGCDMPGVATGNCSPAFSKLFYGADVVISKGQGNFESLSECDRDVYFLLKAKCPVFSEALSVGLNDYVFKHSMGDGEKA